MPAGRSRGRRRTRNTIGVICGRWCSASRRSLSQASVGATIGTASSGEAGHGQGRRHVPRRLGGGVRLHRRLRPDRRVPRRRVGHLLEPARPHARRLQPRLPGAAGNKIVPDLATVAAEADPNGGKTYTFQLKNDVKFAPPVNRAVTSHGHQLRDAAAREPVVRRRSTRSTTR